jgi:hypothetical protein
LYPNAYNYELSATRTGRFGPRKIADLSDSKRTQDREKWFKLLTQFPTLKEIKSDNPLSSVWIEIRQNERLLCVVSLHIFRAAESGFGLRRKNSGAPHFSKGEPGKNLLHKI